MKKILLVALVATSALSFGQVFSTGFEAPTYTAITSAGTGAGNLGSQDGWSLSTFGGSVHQFNVITASSPQQTGFAAATNQVQGQQSIRYTKDGSSDNGIATKTIAGVSTTNKIWSISTDLWIDSVSSNNRAFGIGGSTLNYFMVAKNGNVFWFAGQSAITGVTDISGQWLNLKVDFDAVANTARGTVTGSTFSQSFTLAAPGTSTNFNQILLRSSGFVAGQSSGQAYYDNLSAVPEPMTLGLLALGGAALARRRKAKKS